MEKNKNEDVNEIVRPVLDALAITDQQVIDRCAELGAKGIPVERINAVSVTTTYDNDLFWKNTDFAPYEIRYGQITVPWNEYSRFWNEDKN